ncbi:MAG: hypothetical protein JKY01_02160 [Pseudomonadales bacterium]|nr:hypothetical protein [Pseudomonadales bacterium]
MNIGKFNLISILFIFTIACSSNANQTDMVDELPLIESADDVDKRNIESENYQQLSYKVNVKYPSSDALGLYKNYFLDDEWIKCVGGIEEWSSFIDAATGDEELLVHHVANYWIKESEKKLATVFLKYYSNWPKQNRLPDNDIQNVFVLIHRDIDVRDQAKYLSLSCPK